MTDRAPIPGRSWAALLVGSATVVLVILDAGFISLAFPSIEQHFGEASRTTIGWVFSAYFISLASFMLLAGWLGDRIGRRRVFFFGLLLFGIGAFCTSVSTTVWMLIASRVVQGIGAAALTPVSLAMVLPAFPKNRRAVAVGAWGVAGSLAGIASPTVGAVLIDWLGWRSPFALFLPMTAVIWLVGRRVLPNHPGSDPDGPIDPFGIVLAIVVVAALAIAVTKGDDFGWTSAPTLSAAALSVVGLAVLVRRAETHPGSPFDLDLFRVRSYAASSGVSFLSQAGFFSFFFSFPLFLIDVWGWNTLQTGFAVALNQFSSAAVGLSSGRWADSRGPAGVAITGGCIAAVGFGWLGVGATAAPATWTFLFPALIISGIGSMMIGGTISAAAFHDLSDAQLGKAAGSYYVTRRLGSAAGAVAAVAILGDVTGIDSLDRFRWIWAFSTVCFALSSLGMWIGFSPSAKRLWSAPRSSHRSQR